MLISRQKMCVTAPEIAVTAVSLVTQIGASRPAQAEFQTEGARIAK
jgi:hypothetical protein